MVINGNELVVVNHRDEMAQRKPIQLMHQINDKSARREEKQRERERVSKRVPVKS